MALRPDETWHRLREWTYGQAPSERLAAQVLLSEGYREVDPSHPLGGPDGGKDALCKKDGRVWVMAAYFPRGQKRFPAIKEKFVHDLEGVAKNNASGLVFITNQELPESQRADLVASAGTVEVELYHLERVVAVLDQPSMAPVRMQFLGIELGGKGAPPDAGATMDATDAIPTCDADIYVLQPSEHPGSLDHRASSFFRVRIYSSALRHDPFEPEDEDAFLEAIREAFEEDPGAELAVPAPNHVLVENRGDNLRFHRRWGWWCDGALGMASTLADLNRPGVYSAADVVADVFRLVGLAERLRPRGRARIVFGIDPGRLAVRFEPSDGRARERLHAKLGGIRNVGRPILEFSREIEADDLFDLESQPAAKAKLVAGCVTETMRHLHQARVSTSQMADSIPDLLDKLHRARVL